MMAKRLKHKCLDAWMMYHMVTELHWRPKEILAMETWEQALVSAIAERHAMEVEKAMNK